MNVLFKCFQCIKDEIDENKEKEKEGFIKFVIHSYSKNKVKEPCKKGRLCKHFSEIELNYETKYGFFTIGWKVYIYNVNVRCTKCKDRRLYFADITFNKEKISYEEVRDCHDNVIVYSAHEGKYACGNEGKELQKKINQQVKEIQAAEEKLQKLKEEAERLEKEEKLMREKEERERKEKEVEERKKEKKRKKKKEKKRIVKDNMKKKIKKCLRL